MQLLLNHQRSLRKQRVRSRISGTAERPRLCARITNHHVAIQLIDDVAGMTLAAVSTVGATKATGTMTEKSSWAGSAIAEAAGKHKIKAVVFDRGSRRYHGRLKALAEAARNGGLEF